MKIIINDLTVQGKITPLRMNMAIKWNSTLLHITETIKQKTLTLMNTDSSNDILKVIKEIEEIKRNGETKMTEIENEIELEVKQANTAKCQIAYNKAVAIIYNGSAANSLKQIDDYFDLLCKMNKEQREQNIITDLYMLNYLLKHSDDITKPIQYLKEIGKYDAYIASLYTFLNDQLKGDFKLPEKKYILQVYMDTYDKACKAIFIDHTKTLLGYAVMSKLYQWFSNLFSNVNTNPITKNRFEPILWIYLKNLALIKQHILKDDYQSAIECILKMDGLCIDYLKPLTREIKKKWAYQSVCSLMDKQQKLYAGVNN